MPIPMTNLGASRARCLDSVIVGVVTRLCYSPNVLVPIFLGETKVLVQSEAHVVAVETVSREAKVK